MEDGTGKEEDSHTLWWIWWSRYKNGDDHHHHHDYTGARCRAHGPNLKTKGCSRHLPSVHQSSNLELPLTIFLTVVYLLSWLKSPLWHTYKLQMQQAGAIYQLKNMTEWLNIKSSVWSLLKVGIYWPTDFDFEYQESIFNAKNGWKKFTHPSNLRSARP